MRPLDECLLGRKKSSVVTDGIQLWLDALDTPVSTEGERIFDTNGNSVTGYTAITYADKVTGGDIRLFKPSDAFGEGVYYSLVHDGFVTVNNHSAYGRYYCSTIPVALSAKAVEGIWSISGNSIWSSGGIHCPLYGVYTYYNNYYVYDKQPAGGVPLEQYADGIPHHFIFQINNGIKEIYVDGVLKTAVSATNEILVIDGALNGYMQANFKGEVISFGCYRCYNRPLAAEEILQNYNYEKSLGRVE